MIKKKTAFSAIEIGIVLAIIGLLISGIVIARNSLFLKARNYNIANSAKNSPFIDMPDLALWFDVAISDGFKKSELIDGNVVSSWKNLAPQNIEKFNVAQNNSTKKPKYILDTKDNMPLLRFDGDDFLVYNNLPAYELAKASQVTIFLVQKYDSAPHNNNIIDWSSGAINNFSLSAVNSSGNIVMYFGNGSMSIPASNNFTQIWNIITIVGNENSAQIRVNGINLLSSSLGNLNLSTISNFTIGSNFIGDLREIVIIKKSLTSDELIEAEKHLSRKWNILLGH